MIGLLPECSACVSDWNDVHRFSQALIPVETDSSELDWDAFKLDQLQHSGISDSGRRDVTGVFSVAGQSNRCADLSGNEAVVCVVADQVHHNDCEEAADDKCSGNDFIF